MTFDATYHEQLRGDVRGVLIAASELLPASEVGQIDEFIDHNESGIALETIVDLLVERGKPIDDELAAMIRRLTDRIPVDPARLELLGVRAAAAPSPAPLGPLTDRIARARRAAVRIWELLRDEGSEFAAGFAAILGELDAAGEAIEPDRALRNAKSLYRSMSGGMGSLNDVVLTHGDDAEMTRLNDELLELRGELRDALDG